MAQRSTPPATEAEITRGVPLFLDQLAAELRHGASMTSEISKSAVQHGHDLLRQGFTVGQVVHDYGDICQAITDLAVEVAAPIATDDFRTLNRCLDDAIAAAVTEFGRAEAITQAGETQEVSTLTHTAITALRCFRRGMLGSAEYRRRGASQPLGDIAPETAAGFDVLCGVKSLLRGQEAISVDPAL